MVASSSTLIKCRKVSEDGKRPSVKTTPPNGCKARFYRTTIMQKPDKEWEEKPVTYDGFDIRDWLNAVLNNQSRIEKRQERIENKLTALLQELR